MFIRSFYISDLGLRALDAQRMLCMGHASDDISLAIVSLVGVQKLNVQVKNCYEYLNSSLITANGPSQYSTIIFLSIVKNRKKRCNMEKESARAQACKPSLSVEKN